MTKHADQRTSIASLMGTPVFDARGGILGRVREFAVSPSKNSTHIHRLVLKLTSADLNAKANEVAIEDLQLTSNGVRLNDNASPAATPEGENYLLLERDLLDQQIIDVHGHKVVRVNDVELVWETPTAETPNAPLSLRIAEVEVGLRGAIRRLLKGLPATTVDRLASRFSPSVIPWDFVDLIDRDPARRVRLKIEQDRLSQMHPPTSPTSSRNSPPPSADALFISLNEEVAAEALEEVKPKMQQSLIESLDSEQVAGIVEEMDPGAAADLLSELPDERSEAILEEMDPEERQEVEELLEFAGDSAAGRMTTEYIALPASTVVSQAIEALRDFEGDIEIITDIYLIDEEDES